MSRLEAVLVELRSIVDTIDPATLSGAQARGAVEVQDPVCVIEGCEVRHHLEIDHNIPVACDGLTTTRDCRHLCRHHHDLKTRHDLRRIGPPGRQRLVTKEEYERITAGADP